MHVEAALMAALKNAELKYGIKYATGVKEDSILNAYPLENIK